MQSKYYTGNKSRTYSRERLSTDSKPEQPSIELKVCEDCQVRHSTHAHDHEHDSNKEFGAYNSRSLHRDDFPTHPSQDFRAPTYSSNNTGEKDFFARKNYGSSYEPKQNLSQDRPYFTFEQSDKANNWREGSTMGKAEGTFGYSGYSQRGNKNNVIEESPVRKSDHSNNSYMDTSKDYDGRKAREEIERERVKLEQYSKELNRSLENLSQHLDQSLKKDFDQAAYSLLKKNSPNKENNKRRGNLFTSETEEIAERSYDKGRREEKSYISDYYPSENENRITPAHSKHTRQSDSKRKLATPVYKTEEYSDFPVEDGHSKKASIANSTDRKKIKAYRDIKRHVDTEESIPHSGSDKKSRYGTRTLSADMKEAGEEYLTGNRSVSIQKLNEKLKKNSKPARPAEKKERFLLSPPKEQVGSTFRKFQDIQNTDEEYQEDVGATNDGYDEEYQPRETEDNIDRIREKEMRDQQMREDEYFESLPIEAQVKELEESSIQAIREGNYESALERLLRCEHLIKHGLSPHDPQQIYIQYLLGECYLKLEEYDDAQNVLERAVNSYEVNE